MIGDKHMEVLWKLALQYDYGMLWAHSMKKLTLTTVRYRNLGYPIQRVAKVVPRLVGIVENSFGALDFEKSCLFVKRIGNAWFSGFHDRIYDFI